MKIISSPQSGRLGSIVYLNTRYGLVARQYVIPRNPRTPLQQSRRNAFGAVSRRWRTLTAEQRAAWNLAAANVSASNPTGRGTPRNGYSFFVSLSSKRANLGLPGYDLPPAEPAFTPNPVAELAATNRDGAITLKLRVPVSPAPFTVVQASAPTSAGVRCAREFTSLGLLPSPTDGWSDITALYVARYGTPPVGTVIFIRTCQHIDGWSDCPKLTSALVPSPAA
jgi:hypothetical protein